MSAETPEEELRRLYRERHNLSETLKNTDEHDQVTRVDIQAEMDALTRRMQELREQRDFGPLTKLLLVLVAAVAAYGAYEVDTVWAKIALAVVAAGCVFLSLPM